MSAAAEDVRAVAAAVPDPEIPVLTLGDLGVVRAARLEGERAIVEISPTYSGCPALDPIRTAVEQAVRDRGYDEVEVRTVLAPAWSTDWISEEGRRKLRSYGIAPPAASGHRGCPLADVPVSCPQCDSSRTEVVSRFGATPCQAHYVCRDCAEPFSHFKTLR